MTAATITGSQAVFWRPSVPAAPPLRIAHGLRSDRRLAATVLAAICAFALLLTAIAGVSTLNLLGTESGVAAQTDPASIGVGFGGSETPTTVGENGPWTYDGSLGCCVAPSSASGTAIRQVGRHLESVEDVFGNPQLLAGRGPGDVRAILSGSDNWVEGTMRRSTSAPNGGWTFRELTTDGSNFTGRYIQWHPGTPRHFGGDAYWKVSSGPTGVVRIPQ